MLQERIDDLRVGRRIRTGFRSETVTGNIANDAKMASKNDRKVRFVILSFLFLEQLRAERVF